MKKMRVFQIALLIGLVIGVTVPVLAAEPIKIGCLFAVTGPIAYFGTPQRNTAIMMEEYVNALNGVNGRPIKVINYDTEGDPTKSVIAGKRLIEQDKVDLIIGSTVSGESLALIPTVEAAKIPYISTASSENIVRPVKRWTFKTAHSNDLIVSKIFDDLNKRKLKKVGLLTVATAYGEAGRMAARALAPKQGITLVADMTHQPQDTDMTAQLTQIMSRGAEAIVMISLGTQAAIVAKNYKQLGLKIPIYVGHGLATDKFIEWAGDAANGVRVSVSKLMIADQLPDSELRKWMMVTYTNAYRKRFGGEPTLFGGEAYDGFIVALDAFQAVGIDKEKVRTHIENRKNLWGTSGIFNFSTSDHEGLTHKEDIAILEIVNGKWQFIW